MGLAAMVPVAGRGSPIMGEPITPIPRPPPEPAALVAFGDLLFHDPGLSGNGRLSCASCHDTDTNGADGRTHDVGVRGTILPLNTNTVFNAALSFRLNWEGDQRTLVDQARASLSRPDIMGSSPDRAAAAARRPALAVLSRRAYGHAATGSEVLDAIAAYERTLVTPDSRFDMFLLGDTAALTAIESKGYALFKSTGCSACHQGVNVGGNLWEPHGIFGPLASPEPAVLRVPSLRNIAVTAPYFHDGSARTLTEAVSSMARAQVGRDLPSGDVDAIVAFLGTLTGRLHGRPVTAPPGAP